MVSRKSIIFNERLPYNMGTYDGLGRALGAVNYALELYDSNRPKSIKIISEAIRDITGFQAKEINTIDQSREAKYKPIIRLDKKLRQLKNYDNPHGFLKKLKKTIFAQNQENIINGIKDDIEPVMEFLKRQEWDI